MELSKVTGIEVTIKENCASDVRDGVQRRPGVLGRGRVRPGAVLPEQVQHSQGARRGGDGQGVGAQRARGRRGLWHGALRRPPALPLRPHGEALHVAGGQGGMS